MTRNTGVNGAAGPHAPGDGRAAGDRRGDPLRDDGQHEIALREVARAAARCFGTGDGRTLLAYLRAITVERACGPQVSDAALRDLEGQRRLVHRLTALIDRGRRGD